MEGLFKYCKLPWELGAERLEYKFPKGNTELHFLHSHFSRQKTQLAIVSTGFLSFTFVLYLALSLPTAPATCYNLSNPCKPFCSFCFGSRFPSWLRLHCSFFLTLPELHHTQMFKHPFNVLAATKQFQYQYSVLKYWWFFHPLKPLLLWRTMAEQNTLFCYSLALVWKYKPTCVLCKNDAL